VRPGGMQGGMACVVTKSVHGRYHALTYLAR
jgi:hypothetical protein